MAAHILVGFFIVEFKRIRKKITLLILEQFTTQYIGQFFTRDFCNIVIKKVIPLKK